MWGRSCQQCSKKTWIDEAIASHEQQIAWHRQECSQLVWQSVWAMGHDIQDDIIRQTRLLECGWYGAHPIEVELADTVFVEFFNMPNCQGYPAYWQLGSWQVREENDGRNRHLRGLPTS